MSGVKQEWGERCPSRVGGYLGRHGKSEPQSSKESIPVGRYAGQHGRLVTYKGINRLFRYIKGNRN